VCTASRFAGNDLYDPLKQWACIPKLCRRGHYLDSDPYFRSQKALPSSCLSFHISATKPLLTFPFPPPQVKDLYDPREQWASYILNAIKAKELFLKDVNYIVKNGEIFIVDEFTGRVMEVSLFQSRCLMEMTYLL
jgi:preprotein translocase subunit SecA